VELFTLRECEFDFSTPAAKIDFKRNHGEPTLLHLAGEFIELAAMQQKLARSQRIVIPRSTRTVFGDVAILQPDFAAPDFGISFAERPFAFAQRFYFGTDERYTGLYLVEDMVVVGRRAVLRDNFYAFGFFFGGRFHGG